MSEGELWIPAREAVTQLSLSLGGRIPAKQALADQLRDGLLRSHVDKMVSVPDDGFHGVRLQARGSPYREAQEKLDTEVEVSLWGKSNVWGEDLDTWRWGPGDFQVTVPGENLGLLCQFKLYGVKFLAGEVESLGPTALHSRTCARPELAPTPSVKPRTKVADAELRKWISSRIALGELQKVIVASVQEAFPNETVPDRETCREIHREEHRRVKGYSPKPGC